MVKRERCAKASLGDKSTECKSQGCCHRALLKQIKAATLVRMASQWHPLQRGRLVPARQAGKDYNVMVGRDHPCL